MNVIEDTISGARERVSKGVRLLVSKDKYRYQNDGLEIDLDLTYITNRVIAMGIPAESVASTWRNNLDDVSRFFRHLHPGHYMVFNLSEKIYDYSKLDGRVSHYPWPDHHNPPLNVLCSVVREMDEFLELHPQNVVAVHCLAGRGRTGTIIACFLLWMAKKEQLLGTVAPNHVDAWNIPTRVGRHHHPEAQAEGGDMFSPSAASAYAPSHMPGSAPACDPIAPHTTLASRDGMAMQWPTNTFDALRFFAHRRSAKGAGVAVPSQTRYVRYFEMLLQHMKPSPVRSPFPPGAFRKLVLYSITCSPVPAFAGGVCNPSLDIVDMVNYHSGPIFASRSPVQYNKYDTKFCIVVNKVVCGDILCRVYHESKFTQLRSVIFRFCFNTSFIGCEGNLKSDPMSLHLKKFQLDNPGPGVLNDKKIPSTFTVDVKFYVPGEEPPPGRMQHHASAPNIPHRPHGHGTQERRSGQPLASASTPAVAPAADDLYAGNILPQAPDAYRTDAAASNPSAPSASSSGALSSSSSSSYSYPESGRGSAYPPRSGYPLDPASKTSYASTSNPSPSCPSSSNPSPSYPAPRTPSSHMPPSSYSHATPHEPTHHSTRTPYSRGTRQPPASHHTTTTHHTASSSAPGMGAPAISNYSSQPKPAPAGSSYGSAYPAPYSSAEQFPDTSPYASAAPYSSLPPSSAPSPSSASSPSSPSSASSSYAPYPRDPPRPAASTSCSAAAPLPSASTSAIASSPPPSAATRPSPPPASVGAPSASSSDPPASAARPRKRQPYFKAMYGNTASQATTPSAGAAVGGGAAVAQRYTSGELSDAGAPPPQRTTVADLDAALSELELAQRLGQL